MDIKTIEENDKTIIKINGEIDLYNAPIVRDTVDELIQKKKLNIIINLDDSNFIDSSGIAVLIKYTKHLEKIGGKFIIKCSDNPNIMKIFTLSHLDSLLNIE